MGTAEDPGLREELLDETHKLMLSLESEDDIFKRVTLTVGLPIKHPIRSLKKEVQLASLQGSFGFHLPGWVASPDFLRAVGYKNPTSPTHTALAVAHGYPNGASPWEILTSSPYLDAFNTCVSTFNRGHKSWMDIYPVEDRIVKDARLEPESVAMVDVGGAFGLQAIGLKNRFPQLRGRFIVEDLAQGFPKEKPEDIEFLEHNFLTEQPIRGARLYFLRYVMHDWPQETKIQILTRLREAMVPVYSRLIINEWIIPPKGASRFMASQGFNMGMSFGGMERTEELHRQYIEGSGLTITGIWHPGDRISESVIEVQLLPD
ncbi:MAG: hypothetical protein M1820_008955 [Bogoriella megaspora]|nr:MAG: hypothetical protein M1820_008955 [Bogoriella megaspora]